jgi:hypothetical protein
MCMACMTSAQAVYEAGTLLGGPTLYSVVRRVRVRLGCASPTYAELHCGEPAQVAPDPRPVRARFAELSPRGSVLHANGA